MIKKGDEVYRTEGMSLCEYIVSDVDESLGMLELKEKDTDNTIRCVFINEVYTDKETALQRIDIAEEKYRQYIDEEKSRLQTKEDILYELFDDDASDIFTSFEYTSETQDILYQALKERLLEVFDLEIKEEVDDQ